MVHCNFLIQQEKEKEAAATKIQARYRGYTTRKEVNKLKQEKKEVEQQQFTVDT